ncbi:putative esterase [Mucilaginibacter dorajii]|uniref:BD-FAE-like domain-containing protein n=2 Tax=Mucilaginibacter dorajii TaxID=692994 RepID=A0ABP7P2Q5_9SPHI|nr:alpha/beta hydrolase [Mucilaginibacter dorajii]MCS3735505.1 putative esterase [Mucilaginibacter dorajii]
MYKLPAIILLSLFSMLSAKAQSPAAHQYKDHIFPNVDVKSNLTYNPRATANDKESYLFDLYQPRGDHATARPLIIWMHGGGFKYGSKTAKGIKIWSNDFAQRGYVCAAINYRLSKKNPVFHFDELQKSCYYAVQDAKMAVAYFKEHHAEYNIDPNKIILAGNSAGSIIALQAAYSSNSELSRRTGVVDSTALLKPDDKAKVAGIINFWGGILDTRWLKNARVPIVSAYGSHDRILNPIRVDTGMYGSITIHKTTDSLHIPNSIKVFDGFGHELQRHFNPFFGAGKPTQKRWLQAAQFAADFYYETLFKKTE